MGEEDAGAEAAAKALVEAETDEGSCTFYFVPVARVRASVSRGEKALPQFQVLREEGALVERKLTRSECYRGVHVGKVLAVSHRWEQPGAPDTEGVQLKAILAHLDAVGTLELVWFECARVPEPRLRARAIRADASLSPRLTRLAR